MSKKILFFVMACFAFSGQAWAGPWCDSFGQDWDLNFAPGTGGILVASGCRDCDGSLGCLVVPAVDGALTYDVISTGLVFSSTAFDSAGDTSCVSTHWTGKYVDGAIRGNVSNELGPFGTFTLTPGACRADATGADPAQP